MQISKVIGLKIYHCLIVLIVLLFVACNSYKPRNQVDISSSWQFRETGDQRWYPAKVPGVIHPDLLANGLIPDPFVGTNEDSVQWIEEKQWEYKTSFNISSEQYSYQKIELVFDGLDTYAKVFLNGKAILEANNMFRKWRIKVKENIVIGENELRIVFTSPITKNKLRLEELGYTLPAGSETGKWPVSPFTRKAAYQFGWDFAPRLVTMGIWQRVYLDLWDAARIENVVFVSREISLGKADYTANVTIFSIEANATYTLRLLEIEKEINLNAGFNEVSIDISIKNPKLWWPNGWGEPYLYKIPIQLAKGDIILDSLNQKLGIRTIDLIQEYDAMGKSFYFMVNGEKLFAKGANWSPLSTYPGSVADSVYQNRIRAVKEANMNMLRVWGGGIYERDLFYDLCDENGILVWQDFMFANSMYPGSEKFIKNITVEVEEQIKRLRTHPSLVLWNGNNEIDVAWKNWGWQQQYGYSVADSTKIWRDYENLFLDIIPELVKKFDPGRSFTPTSPISNWGAQGNFTSGSMHYWGVWHGDDSFEDYKFSVGRFMAEYGFQSFPDKATIDFYSSNSLDVEAPSSHQKSYIGNGLISKESEKYFGKPIATEDFIIKSQQTQALALKLAIEAHRLNKDKCGGTLFWQLNDCWPGPSWSVIDYFGRKKLAYHMVKDRFKPVILVFENEGNKLSISVVNDLLMNVSGKLKLELFSANDTRLWVSEKSVHIPENGTEVIYRSDTRKLLDGMVREEVYLKATLTINGDVVDDERFYFVAPKNFLGNHSLF